MALIAAHLNAGHSGGDSVAIGIQSPSPPTSVPTHPFSPSLISRTVSVDVKHHVYLLTGGGRTLKHLAEGGGVKVCVCVCGGGGGGRVL